MKKIAIILLTLLFASEGYSQRVNSRDSLTIRSIYDMALLNGESYDWLDYLSNNIGGRLSGTLNAEKAVQYTKEELDKLGLDKVWLQPVMVPKWTRGFPEYAYVETGPGKTLRTNVCALGGSVATSDIGLKARVIEVQGIEDLALYGREQIEGKIVFYNRPMDVTLHSTFHAYGRAVDQRGAGPVEAAKKGYLTDRISAGFDVGTYQYKALVYNPYTTDYDCVLIFEDGNFTRESVSDAGQALKTWLLDIGKTHGLRPPLSIF